MTFLVLMWREQLFFVKKKLIWDKVFKNRPNNFFTPSKFFESCLAKILLGLFLISFLCIFIIDMTQNLSKELLKPMPVVPK